jgi:hypothetical protein
VRYILDDFGKISGLVCNVDKTVLMRIGTVGLMNPRILQLAFDVKDEMTSLGIKIKNGYCDFESSIIQINDKLNREINF